MEGKAAVTVVTAFKLYVLDMTAMVYIIIA